MQQRRALDAEQRVVGTATTPASESRYGLLVEQGTGGSSAATLVELPKLRNFDDLVAKIAPQPPLPSLQHGFPTNDEILDETGASKYRRCLIRPESPVKFLGDSHLRYVFDHLVGGRKRSGDESLLGISPVFRALLSTFGT